MIITGPKFEIGQVVKPTKETPKSNVLNELKNSLEPYAKITNSEIVKRFPGIDIESDDEYIYMLEFENGAKIASSWFEPVEKLNV